MCRAALFQNRGRFYPPAKKKLNPSVAFVFVDLHLRPTGAPPTERKASERFSPSFARLAIACQFTVSDGKNFPMIKSFVSFGNKTASALRFFYSRLSTKKQNSPPIVLPSMLLCAPTGGRKTTWMAKGRIFPFRMCHHSRPNFYFVCNPGGGAAGALMRKKKNGYIFRQLFSSTYQSQKTKAE